jgi:hypothetical protein
MHQTRLTLMETQLRLVSKSRVKGGDGFKVMVEG